MKNLHSIYTIVLLMMINVSSTNLIAQPNLYQQNIKTTPILVKKQGDILKLQIQYTISDIPLPSNRYLILIPEIVAQSQSQTLPQVIIKGANSYKAYKRDMVLQKKKNTADPDQIVLKATKETQTIIQSLSIPYQTWMKNASIVLRYDICGCGDAPRSLFTSQVALISVFTPNVAYCVPKSESINDKAVREVYIDFPVAKTKILPDYLNNKQTLDSITHLIKSIEDTPDTQIDSIYIIGYASPEGTLAFNQTLSENRAKALAKYLSSQLRHSDKLYKISYGGENWKGLLQKVQNSEMPQKAQIIDILQNVPSEINYKQNTGRKKSLMDLDGGIPYTYMLKEFFPYLRTAECVIYYSTELSVNSSYQKTFEQALHYPQNSQEYRNAMFDAALMYPNDDTANLNAAVAAIRQSDAKTAKQYLDKVKNTRTAQYYNVLGCFYAMQENNQQAIECLTKAFQNGSNQAKENLKQLQ